MHATVTQNTKGFTNTAAALRQLVIHSVEEKRGDSILLSGGFDTSVVAAIACRTNEDLGGYTVVLKDFPAPDLNFSKMIAAKLDIGQELLEVTLEDVEDSIPQVIRILRSFDPMEVRNSVPIYLGLTRAKSEGYSRVLTGDAADELFAGYSFVTSLPKDQALIKLHHLWTVMHFSSIPLAASLEIKALLPFLDEEVKQFAMSEIPFEFLVGVNNVLGGPLFGKFILRKAFEDMLPSEITWRKKTPIEFGSGTTVLPEIYKSKIDALEFANRRKWYLESDKVRIRDEEQFHYYEIYRREFNGPPESDPSRRACPACRANVGDSANFCTTCGEYPI